MTEKEFQLKYENFQTSSKELAIEELKKLKRLGFDKACVVFMSEFYCLMLKRPAVLVTAMGIGKIVY